MVTSVMTLVSMAVLGKTTIAVMKHQDQSSFGRKGLIWPPYPESQSTEGSQGRNSRQELRGSTRSGKHGGCRLLAG